MKIENLKYFEISTYKLEKKLKHNNILNIAVTIIVHNEIAKMKLLHELLFFSFSMTW